MNDEWRMNHVEVMHYVAQAVINISEAGSDTIEAESPIHNALRELCRMASEGKIEWKED